jgi:dihydroxyacetone kinase
LVLQNAEKSAKETANMTAKVGRASYTAANVQNQPDAGAMAISIWMRAIYNAILN